MQALYQLSYSPAKLHHNIDIQVTSGANAPRTCLRCGLLPDAASGLAPWSLALAAGAGPGTPPAPGGAAVRRGAARIPTTGSTGPASTTPPAPHSPPALGARALVVARLLGGLLAEHPARENRALRLGRGTGRPAAIAGRSTLGAAVAAAARRTFRLLGSYPDDQPVLLRRGGIAVLLPHVIDHLLQDEALRWQRLQGTGTLGGHLLDGAEFRRPGTARAPAPPPAPGAARGVTIRPLTAGGSPPAVRHCTGRPTAPARPRAARGGPAARRSPAARPGRTLGGPGPGRFRLSPRIGSGLRARPPLAAAAAAPTARQRWPPSPRGPPLPR